MNRKAAGGPTAAHPRPGLADAATRGAMLTFVWWVLAEGSWRTPWLAGAVILTALATSFALVPAVAWRLPHRALTRFIPYFLGQSLRGGFDVARRALHPRLLIEPGFIEHELFLAPGPARTAFTGILSLLPGTLSVQMTAEHTIRIHVLDVAGSDTARLRELEQRVALLFDPAAHGAPGRSSREG
jgi:multicomponent Na+:H+ antiporter subunit E